MLVWFWRCVGWCKRTLSGGGAVEGDSPGPAVPECVARGVDASKSSESFVTENMKKTVVRPDDTVEKASGETMERTIDTELSASGDAYTATQLAHAQAHLKEMQLLLINYAQQAALASQQPEVSAAQTLESEVFIQEMTACISELNSLLCHIQSSSGATQATADQGAKAGPAV